jgi:hypothetical protein
MLIITFSWGFPTSFLVSTTHQRNNNLSLPIFYFGNNKFFGAVAMEKEDFCKGSLSLPIFYFVNFLLYFIFTCIILTKIQKK